MAELRLSRAEANLLEEELVRLAAALAPIMPSSMNPALTTASTGGQVHLALLKPPRSTTGSTPGPISPSARW
jgi:hypothetical protein